MSERLDDMLARYGEICRQKKAAHILNVCPRTISRMMDDGRLRRVEGMVDVRSICAYLEDPTQRNVDARLRKKYPRNLLAQGEFFAASRSVKRAKEA